MWRSLRRLSLTALIAVLVVGGAFFLALGITIWATIHGSPTFESVRFAIKGLLAVVFGAGLVLVAWAVMARLTQEET